MPKDSSTTDETPDTQGIESPRVDEQQKLQSQKQACLAARIADEFKGQDIVVLDLTEITPIFDFFVISTGSSRRQMHAVAEEVDRALNDVGSERRGIEGYQESQWIVQDYGDVVLHVMTAEAREAYDLEGLWADAGRIDWQADG